MTITHLSLSVIFLTTKYNIIDKETIYFHININVIYTILQYLRLKYSVLSKLRTLFETDGKGKFILVTYIIITF